MTDESITPQDASPRTDGGHGGTNGQTGSVPRTLRARSAGSRNCSNCGSRISAQASVCPACGESLKESSGRIRCRHCGERSSSELTLCPYCGRELESAPSRVLTWGVPIALVLLFLVFIVRQADGTSPLAWAQDRLTLSGLPTAETAERGLVVMMTPVSSEPVAETGAPGSSGNEESVVEPAEENADAAAVAEADETVSAENGSEETGTTSTVDTTEYVMVSSSAPMTATEATPVALATSSDEERDEAEGSAPARPDAQVAEEVLASTPEGIPTAAAEAEPVVGAASMEETRAPAGLPTATPTSTETATPIVTSTSTSTETPVPTDTATPVPMPTYVIQRGDTLVVVARKHDVSVEDLMRVNSIGAAQAFTIQPGQELLIPVEGSVGAQDPTATPTSTPVPTAAVPPTNTPLPTPTSPAVRLDAPILRSPEPGTPVSCSTPTSLTWLPVPFMRTDDKFILHLGFVSGRTEDGRELVTWVLEQPRPANVTSWDMDGTLCALAPQEYQRKWHWWVEVAAQADGGLVPVSPPSETWHFNWN